MMMSNSPHVIMSLTIFIVYGFPISHSGENARSAVSNSTFKPITGAQCRNRSSRSPCRRLPPNACKTTMTEASKLFKRRARSANARGVPHSLSLDGMGVLGSCVLGR